MGESDKVQDDDVLLLSDEKVKNEGPNADVLHESCPKPFKSVKSPTVAEQLSSRVSPVTESLKASHQMKPPRKPLHALHNTSISKSDSTSGSAGANPQRVAEVKATCIVAGSLVLARVEDTWQPATVTQVVQPGQLYIVQYQETKQFGGVSPDKIKLWQESEVGSKNSNTFGGFAIGDVCIARWSEDNVYYNAKILEELSNGKCKVIFLDYGNEDIVSEADLVASGKEIPTGSNVDVYVDQSDDQETRSDKSLVMVETPSHADLPEPLSEYSTPVTTPSALARV